jgi:DnaJ domain
VLTNFQSRETGSASERPDFMEFLELLPPYTSEDIQKAYKALSLRYHPDRGGSTAQFMKLQKAYDQAQEYVRFRQGRREWMANLVEPYMRQQEVVEEVQKRQGDVRVEKVDWMQNSFGDFATLTERLRTIDLQGSEDVDGFIEFLMNYQDHVGYLEEMNLEASSLTDKGLERITKFESLKRLNLANTSVTLDGINRLVRLKSLCWLNLSGVKLGWWNRRAVRKKFPNVDVVF